jgi:hypothetical protein
VRHSLVSSAPHGALDVALGVGFLQDLSLVVQLAAAAQA